MSRKWILLSAIGLLTILPLIPTMPDINAQGVLTPSAQNVEVLGQIGGVSRAVAVQGDTAYLGVGPRVLILNVADPAQPIFIGQTPILPYIVNDVRVMGDYVYVATGEGIPYKPGYDVGEGKGGLHIFDVSNPATPVEVGIYSSTNTAFGVAIVGNIAYIANGEGGLRFVDISSPTSPSEIGFYDTPISVQDVTVAGNIAYVADHQVLRLIDVSNPNLPVELGHIPSFAWSVDIMEHYAYVAGGSGGVHIIDVTNPEAPIDVVYHGSWHDPSLGVAVNENIAYVTGEDGRLRLVDVSNPTTPVEISTFQSLESFSSFEDIEIHGTIAYIVNGGGGLHLIDINNPIAPVEAGFYDTLGSAQEVTVAGNIAYVTDVGSDPGHPTGGRSGLRLRTLDVTDPHFPREISWLYSSDDRINVHETENIHYLLFSSGLYVVDVSNQESLTVVDYFSPTPPRQAWDFAMSKDAAYIVNGDGLLIIDISDLANPFEASRIELYVAGVEVANNIAYVAADSGLRVFDVTSPANPVEIGFYDTPSQETPNYIGLSEDLVCLVDERGLYVIDVANPMEPKQVGFFDTSYPVRGMEAAENTVYLASAFDGLRVIDVSDPANPVEVGYFDTSGDAADVVVAGDVVFVADEEGGLVILRYTEDGNDTAGEVIEPVADLAKQAQGYGRLPIVAGGLIGLVIVAGGVLVWRRWRAVPTVTDSGICPQCGTLNPSDARFCKQCGRQRE